MIVEIPHLDPEKGGCAGYCASVLAARKPAPKGPLVCGRFTVKATRPLLARPPHNLQPRYNVYPTDSIDASLIERIDLVAS